MAPTAQDQSVHNVVIVGSGPAGYTAAIYTAPATRTGESSARAAS